MILHGAWHKANRSGKKSLSPALWPERLLLFSALGQGFRPPAPLVLWSLGSQHSHPVFSLGFPQQKPVMESFSSVVEAVPYNKAVSFCVCTAIALLASYWTGFVFLQCSGSYKQLHAEGNSGRPEIRLEWAEMAYLLRSPSGYCTILNRRSSTQNPKGMV